MLWFHDNRALALQSRLEQAIRDYQNCYGLRPTVCCLPPDELKQHQRLARSLKLSLSASDHLQPGQFWLGSG
jgi:hypothetical protein